MSAPPFVLLPARKVSFALALGSLCHFGGAFGAWAVVGTENPPAALQASDSLKAEAAYEFARAKLLADAGDWKGALAAYNKVVELDPQDPYHLIELVKLHLYLAQVARLPAQANSEIEAAADRVSRARELSPENPDVLRIYAQTHMRRAEINSASLPLAQGAFEVLRKKAPGDLTILSSLAQIYSWTQENDKAIEVLTEAANFFPRHRMVLGMLSEALLASGRNDEAIEVLIQLIEVEPGNAESFLRLAELLSQKSRHRQAVEVLESAVASAPSNRVKQLLAREYHLAHENEKALALTEAIADPATGLDGYRRLRAAIFAGLARYSEAIAELEKAPTSGDANRRRDDAMLISRFYERLGDGDRAVSTLEKLFEGSSVGDKVRLELALAGVLSRFGRLDNAIERLNRAVSKSVEAPAGERAALHELLAELLQKRGDFAATELALASARELSQDSTARENLELRSLILASNAREWDFVVKQTAKIEAVDRAEISGARRQLRAEALAQLGRVDEAIAVVAGDLPPDRAKRLQLLFDHGRAEVALAELAVLAKSEKREDKVFAVQILQRANRHEAALPIARELSEAEPESLPLRFAFAVSTERSGDWVNALPIFEAILAREPDHAGALNYLGYTLAENNRELPRALALIQRAIALEPDNGAYVDSLGWVLFQLGRFEEAQQHLEWAVRLVDDDATLHEHLGAVYAKLGQVEPARRAYRRAIELDATKAEALEPKLRALGKK